MVIIGGALELRYPVAHDSQLLAILARLLGAMMDLERIGVLH